MEQLAIGPAAGMTVAEWCRRTGCPTSTAHGWARLPDFPARVQAHRLALVGRELDRLADRLAMPTAGDPPPLRLARPDDADGEDAPRVA